MSDDDEFFDKVGTKITGVRCCRCRVQLTTVYSIDTAWEGGTRYDYCQKCHFQFLHSGNRDRGDWFIWMVSSGPGKRLPISTVKKDRCVACRSTNPPHEMWPGEHSPVILCRSCSDKWQVASFSGQSIHTWIEENRTYGDWD